MSSSERDRPALAACLTSSQIVYTLFSVLIEFDPVKDAKNRANHDGISLGEYAAMDLAAAIACNSPRHGEARIVQVGPIAGRLHVAVVTSRRRDAGDQPPESEPSRGAMVCPSDA